MATIEALQEGECAIWSRSRYVVRPFQTGLHSKLALALTRWMQYLCRLQLAAGRREILIAHGS
jgi:hypothetical protein